MIFLPEEFLDKIKSYLGTQFADFLTSYDQPRASGVRANGLKISAEKLPSMLSYLAENVPWCQAGYYYNEVEYRPAKSPYYYAGLYYIQEPSAMLPAELLEVKPGEKVLDLCAAPGGKSTQLAAKLGKAGLLVVNDNNANRARVLLKNIERYGVVNAIVLNDTPDRLINNFAGFFDKILVDAPCSGEGMFHKEPEMAKEWSQAEVDKYAQWQAEILEVIPQLLAPDGEVVYSTCTFSAEEDEQQVDKFIAKYPDFKLLAKQRLWPHEVKGEGHFAAKMKLVSSVESNIKASKAGKNRDTLSKTAQEAIAQFSEQVWGDADLWQKFLPEQGKVVERAGHILWESDLLPILKGLKILRSGWLLGTVDKGRFAPSAAYALGLTQEAVELAKQKYQLSAKNEEEKYEAIRYLRGETISIEGKAWPKGWHLVCLDTYPLGWAKGAGFCLKNQFPPGWRWEDKVQR